MTPETKASLVSRANKLRAKMLRSGILLDEFYGEPDYDVNVYVHGNVLKAVAYPVSEDGTTDYNTIINLWEKPL